MTSFITNRNSSKSVMEEDMERIVKRFSNNHRDLPQILLSYQQLKADIRQYFEELLSNFTDSDALSPFEFYLQLPTSNPKWFQLSSYSSILGPDIKLDHQILTHNYNAISQSVNYWHEILTQRIISELESNRQLELPNITELKAKVYRVSLYFLKIRMIALIEDESIFFTELMSLGSPQILVFFAKRLKQRKSQLQLRKYMMRRVYSKLPENFEIEDVLAFLQYFEDHASILDNDQILDLIPQIERFKIGFRKKVPAYQQFIKQLEEEMPEKLVDLAWNYPRLQVRNLFIPAFTRNTNNREIRRYWNEHSSQTSKNALLAALHGITTDPYFLSILFRESPTSRRMIINSLLHYQIEDRDEVVEFLKAIPDNYSLSEIDAIFNNYWGRDYRLFSEILERLDSMDPNNQVSNLIRAKFRLAGIMT